MPACLSVSLSIRLSVCPSTFRMALLWGGTFVVQGGSCTRWTEWYLPTSGSTTTCLGMYREEFQDFMVGLVTIVIAGGDVAQIDLMWQAHTWGDLKVNFL